MSGDPERFDLAINNARLVTLAGRRGPRRGREAMRDLGIVERGSIGIRDGRIAAVVSDRPLRGVAEVEARGRVVTPGLIDCHTHACWAGSRLEEWEMRLAGAEYLAILEAGGGILSTVRAVREASEGELACSTAGRLGRMLSWGTTWAEVKSGYGFTTEAEVKMLRAIGAAAKASGLAGVQPTFLGAHAKDPEQPGYVDAVIGEMLPAVVEAFGPIACDVYCERGAWSVEEMRRLFEAAAGLGCRLRAHVDQFTSLGGTRLAVEMGAVSVDHLEAISAADVALLGESETIGVLLPVSGLHVDGRYAPGRALIDAGAAIAVASNYNPGSAPSASLPLAMGLACRQCGLSPAEALCAATMNAACVLGVEGEAGSLEAGKRADLVLWEWTDEREIVFELGSALPAGVWVGGMQVRGLVG